MLLSKRRLAPWVFLAWLGIAASPASADGPPSPHLVVLTPAERPPDPGLIEAIQTEAAVLLGERSTVVEYVLPEGALEPNLLPSDESKLDPTSAHPRVFVGLGLHTLPPSLVDSAMDRPWISVDDSGWELALPDEADGDHIRRVYVPSGLQQDLEIYAQLTGLHRVTVMADAGSRAIDENLEQRLQQDLETWGLQARFVWVNPESSTAEAILSLPDDTVGVYLAPHLTGSSETLAKALQQRRLPAVSGRGRQDVEAGVTAAYDRPGHHALARRIVLAASDVLRGVDLHTLATPTGHVGTLVVHSPTLVKLDLELPWTLQLEAERFAEPAPQGGTLDMASVLRQAIELNLDLAVRRLNQTAADTALDQAKAARRLQLLGRLDGSWIDEDTAEVSLGGQPERRLTGGAEASWQIYSEPQNAEVEVQTQQSRARAWELTLAELQVARLAGGAYLDVLLAQNVEDIERQNLRLTRSQLVIAQDRQAVGAGGRGDVARLEAQLARGRSRLVEAHGRSQTAELRLNRLLHRPLETAVALNPEEAAAPTAYFDAFPFTQALQDTESFDLFRRRGVAQALEKAPELAALEARRAAAVRQRQSAERSFRLPEVALRGAVTFDLEESGAGLDPPSLPGFEGLFPQPTDERWSLGIAATLPFLTGGARSAELRRATLTVDALQRQWEDIAEGVEQTARTALIDLQTGYRSSLQSGAAARAALEAYEVIADGYRLGSEPLSTLLDAQTEARVAQLESIASIFDFRRRWLDWRVALGGFPELDPDAAAFDQELLNQLESILETP